MSSEKTLACTMTKDEQQIVFDLFSGNLFKDTRKLFFEQYVTMFISISGKIDVSRYTKDCYGVEKNFGCKFVSFQEFLRYLIDYFKVKKN